MRRVVITGMGAITPLGLNVEEYWQGLKEGHTAFGLSLIHISEPTRH